MFLLKLSIYLRYGKSIKNILLADERIESNYRYEYRFFRPNRELLSSEYKSLIGAYSLEYISENNTINVHLPHPVKESIVLLEPKMIGYFNSKGEFHLGFNLDKFYSQDERD